MITEISYKYDVLGRRLRKDVINHANQFDITKNYKINYIYRGENIAVELDANDNVVIAQHLHSPLKSDDILKSNYTSRAKDLGFAKNTGTITYIKDHLGTVTELVDSNGNTNQRYSYTSYGVLRSISNGDGSQDITLTPEVKPYFTYTEREWDSEVGLYYYRARYYDANTGRFLQKDPDPGKLALPSTFFSKYIYGVNNPIIFSDPSGMSILSEVFDAFFQAGHDFIATFGAGFDNFIKNKTVQAILVLVAAAFIGPAVAGLMGATGWTAIGISAGVGGLVGGIGFQGLGIGTFEQGFLVGALVGGASAYMWGNSGLYGNSNPVYNYLSGEIKTFRKTPLFDYFFKMDHADTGILAGWFGDGFGGPTWGGILTIKIIKSLIPEKKEEGN